MTPRTSYVGGRLLAVYRGEFERLTSLAEFGDDDRAALRRLRDVLDRRIDVVYERWDRFFEEHAYLIEFYPRNAAGDSDDEYMDKAWARFREWFFTTADATFDDRWLAAQAVSAERHVRSGPNPRGGIDFEIPLQYLIAMIAPMGQSFGPVLADEGFAPSEIREIETAWQKAVSLQIALWSFAYLGPVSRPEAPVPAAETS
jgi:hypothetical protein